MIAIALVDVLLSSDNIRDCTGGAEFTGSICVEFDA